MAIVTGIYIYIIIRIPDSPGSGWGLVVSFCDYSNELLVSLEVRKFLD
jgi:hypothetical protein